MKVSKLFAALFALLGAAVAAFTIWLSLTCRDSLPLLLKPAEDARSRIVALLDAVCLGDYDTAGTMMLGAPELGVDREPTDTAGRMIWQVFGQSFSYTLAGDCYVTADGLAQDITLTHLDLDSVTEPLQGYSQQLLAQRVEQATDVSQIYDENNEYRESFVMEVLHDAVALALAQDARQTTVALTVNLVYRDDAWWVVADEALLEAISGGIVH